MDKVVVTIMDEWAKNIPKDSTRRIKCGCYKLDYPCDKCILSSKIYNARSDIIEATNRLVELECQMEALNGLNAIRD